jgi:hypothetical protein
VWHHGRDVVLRERHAPHHVQQELHDQPQHHGI